MNDITVILNCYKRPRYLKEQIQTIENQTIKPKEIWIWYNAPEDEKQIDLSKDFGNYKIVTSNTNFKFHGRFALGLLAQTEYVVFFDDDTMPGSQWFENCLKTMDLKGESILGTTGVVFNGRIGDYNYENNTKVGWNGSNNEVPAKVDLVGHSWFMKKSTLKYLFYEEPLTWDNGEDIQLSYLALKYNGIETYVPPHPANNQELWGSKKSTGWRYGTDSKSSWRRGSHMNLRNDIVKKYREDGWIPAKHRKNN